MNRLSFAILTNKLFSEWIKNNRSFVDVQVSLEETEYDEFMSIIYESKNIYAFLTYSKYYNIFELTEEFLNSLKEVKPKEYQFVKIYMESIENSIKEIVNMEYIIHLYNFLLMFSKSNFPKNYVLLYQNIEVETIMSIYPEKIGYYEQTSIFIQLEKYQMDTSKERYELKNILNNLIKNLLKESFSNSSYCEFKSQFIKYLEESNIPRKSILDYEMFMNYYHANMRKYFSTKEDKEKRLLKETLDIFNYSL